MRFQGTQMKQSDLLYSLSELDRRGRRVFTVDDMAKIMGITSARTLESTLYREVRKKKPLLARVAHGVYMNALSQKPMTHIQEEIARALRRGARNYVSFESALSEHGRISQIPVGTLTVATTGRAGRFTTPYGMIEFTQVKHSAVTIAKNVLDTSRPLAVANEDFALEDLKAAKRNLHLVIEEPEEDEELTSMPGGL